jgi:serine/threonine protein kinase
VQQVRATALAADRLLDGRYRLVRLLGSGGMASVWLADDELLGRQVAVKLPADSLTCDDRYLARFRREARLAARLSHPRLVDVYDFSSDFERPYLVMAYVPGPSLADRPAVDPQRLARELLEAVGAIHAVGIVHRDIKPSNVLLDESGSAQLTDFGVATADDTVGLTGTDQVLGTVRFMAPEVLRGQPATVRSDLYGVGMVLSEIGDPALQPLITRLTDADPARRPASAAEALARLAEPDQPTVEVPRPPRHAKRAVAIAAVLAAAALLIAAIALSSSGHGRPVHRAVVVQLPAQPVHQVVRHVSPPPRPRPTPARQIPAAVTPPPACAGIVQQVQQIDQTRGTVARQLATAPPAVAQQVLSAYAAERQQLENMLAGCVARSG